MKTTESSSMTSSSSLPAITENGFFSVCFAFCAAFFLSVLVLFDIAVVFLLFVCFLSLSFFSFFLLLLIFPHHIKGCLLEGWPRMR